VVSNLYKKITNHAINYFHFRCRFGKTHLWQNPERLSLQLEHTH